VGGVWPGSYERHADARDFLRCAEGRKLAGDDVASGVGVIRDICWSGLARLIEFPCTPAGNAFPASATKKDSLMNIALAPLISLIAGILILLMPRLLNYIVAIYLIVIGIVGLMGNNFNLTF